MKTSPSNKQFMRSFELISEQSIDDYDQKHLNLYMLKTNANDFNYDALMTSLLDPLIDFALSRVVKKQYAGRPGALSNKARSEFRRVTQNKGELGELLLYCFLESHMKAPKILTKYELKTSANNYVNGSDGVHYYALENGNYQLIFCESKTYTSIGKAISDAFNSIMLFKNEINEKGVKKSGISYEKSLISNHLTKETFTKADLEFLKTLLYPGKTKETNKYHVDDAFAIFIGYEIKISDEDKAKPNDIFRDELKASIAKYVAKKIKSIKIQIKECGLNGHSIYVYVVPFTELEASRTKILEGILA